jgi:uncharacterized protein
MAAGLSIIIKPTYACNAACDYCSVHKLGEFIKPMSKETFDQLGERLKEFFADKGEGSGMTFYWLGGEPLVMPNAFYEYVYEQTAEGGWENDFSIEHTFQSNLILFKKKDNSAAKKLMETIAPDPTHDWKYQISSSYDPVSDARKLKNGESYEKEFLRTYFEMKKEGAKIGLIQVVHSGVVGKAEQIYNFYKNIKTSGININAMVDFQGEFSPDDLEMLPKDFGEFMIDMWRRWKEDKYSLSIVPFESWRLLRDHGNSALLRCHNDGVCSGNLFAVGPDGDVFHCDRSMQAYEEPLGNIAKDSFEKMGEMKTNRERIEHIKANQCAGCEWWEYCKGGCPYESKGQYKGYYDKSHWCESYKMLFEYINGEGR